MSKTIRVEAVPGQLCPVPGRTGEFIGLRRRREGDSDSAVMHRVPGHERTREGGREYVSAGAVNVTSTPYIRRCIARGSLRQAIEAPKTRKKEG